MDFNAVATNALRYLTQTNNMPEDYSLHAITLSRYIPRQAVEAANDSILNNWNHWVIECEFDAKPRHPIYHLYMLLDGRVLGVTEVTG